jgi:hypothetical protein
MIFATLASNTWIPVGYSASGDGIGMVAPYSFIIEHLYKLPQQKVIFSSSRNLRDAV